MSRPKYACQYPLIENVTFPDTAGTSFVGTVEIANEGRQLVYTPPKSDTTIVLFR